MATEARTGTAMGAVAMLYEKSIFGKRGILELRDGRLTFRTATGTLVDVPAGDVHDVTTPPRSWTGVNPNALLRCTIGDRRYLFAIQLTLPGAVPDDQVTMVLNDTLRQSRPTMRAVLPRIGLKLFGMGVGAAIPIAESVEMTGIPEHLIFPEHEIPPEVLRRQPAAAWRQALTGEPIPAAPLPTFWQRHPNLGAFWGSVALGIVLRQLIHGGVETFPLGVVMIAVVIIAGIVIGNVHRSRAWLTHYLSHGYLIRGEVGAPPGKGGIGPLARSRAMVLAGAVLLFVGLLLPTISTSDWSHNYFQEHTVESIVLLLCAAGAGYLVYRARQAWSWVPGLIALLVLAEAAQAERAHAEDLASGLFSGTVTYWQWPCTLALFVGAALLLVAPLVHIAQQEDPAAMPLAATASALESFPK